VEGAGLGVVGDHFEHGVSGLARTSTDVFEVEEALRNDASESASKHHVGARNAT
jgi:hypothetical protein